MANVSLLSRYNSWMAYRRTVRSLSKLDNRELDDLGISRADIPAIAARSVL